MPSLVPSRPFTLRSIVMVPSELDLDVDAGRQVEAHQGVDGLRGGVNDVDEALVGAHLEVLAGVLVLVRRANDAVDVLLGRQRHRAGDLRTRTGDGVHDLPRRGVDHLVVIGLEPDADLLSRHRSLSSSISYAWSGFGSQPLVGERRLSLLHPPTPAVGRVAWPTELIRLMTRPRGEAVMLWVAPDGCRIWSGHRSPCDLVRRTQTTGSIEETRFRSQGVCRTPATRRSNRN